MSKIILNFFKKINYKIERRNLFSANANQNSTSNLLVGKPIYNTHNKPRRSKMVRTQSVGNFIIKDTDTDRHFRPRTNVSNNLKKMTDLKDMNIKELTEEKQRLMSGYRRVHQNQESMNMSNQWKEQLQSRFGVSQGVDPHKWKLICDKFTKCPHKNCF